MAGVLILEDGTCFPGNVFGYRGQSQGEVVINTGILGYQEILTDPTYYGQIVVLTYPLIGNYGINPSDNQGLKPYVQGLIVRENCSYYNNWRATGSLENFLASNGIVGLEGVDTRALSRHIRAKGPLKGIITSASMSQAIISRNTKNLVQEVTTQEVKYFPGSGPKVVVIDLGIKKDILEALKRKGFEIYLVPSWFSEEQILAFNPQGIFLSNGPGDPKDVPEVIEVVKSLIGKLPIFGIALGHQIISLALGANTYKMKFGHRGVNYPVQDVLTKRVYITSQNHGYEIEEATLPQDVFVSHRNLNDGTMEGLRHKFLPIFSIQYHPEVSSEQEDLVFKEFHEVMVG
ncbi:MAG: glutamine-hydrolyzing carbamoyl-phosphate synthase small subunit [Clostridia bacterium]|nr:glutamine-hydrolyzing carbamoyl-phosphate synthase small subunit [Clostridia bacterium]